MSRVSLSRFPPVLLAAALAAACATVEPLALDAPDPGPLDPGIAARFCYDAAEIGNAQALKTERRKYSVYDVTLTFEMEGQGETAPITLEYYRPAADGPSPVVLVLPILNGQKIVMRPFATHFANNGYATVIVDTLQRKTLTEDMVEPEAAIRETVIKHRRVLDWIEQQPELDASRIGVFGASLGGFNALYLAALDDRVRAVVPALVAGDLPYVFVHSDEDRIVRAVEAAKQDLSMTDEEFEAYLREHIETDLLTLAPHVRAERVLMVLARRDKAVPYEKQVELREALGNPEALYLPSGHVSASAYLFYIQSHARAFFDRTLGAGNIDSVAELPGTGCQ